jgi:hypothetical protein
MKRKARRKTESTEQRLRRWLRRHHTPERLSEAQALPLRRDMVTLLEYVRDNKVVGARSTGNMPLKVIRALTAQFVDPPVLDTTIGEHTYKLRTEYDVWPLHFLHILAEVGGLLSIAPRRRWRLTPAAPTFLESDPLFQLSFLLFTWWFNVNWLVAFPVRGIGEDLPDSFELVTLARLRYLRVGTEVPLNVFADGLIEEAGLTWTAPDMSFAQMSLRSAIERMVVRVLEDFGAVKCSYRSDPVISYIRKLLAFEITPLGRALLDSLVIQETWE